MANAEELETRPEGAEGYAPPPKRKKTVTWAGDLPGTSAGDEGPQSSGEQEEPAVVVVELGAQDPLLAGLDAALLSQEDVPGHSKEPLGEDELLQRRMGNIDRLYELYQEEMWSLYEELHLRQRQFVDQQQEPQPPQQQQQEPPQQQQEEVQVGEPGEAAAQQGEEGQEPAATASAQTGNEEAQQPPTPANLRQLWKQMRQRHQAAAVRPPAGAAQHAGQGRQAPVKVAQPDADKLVSAPSSAAAQQGQGPVQGQAQGQQPQSNLASAPTAMEVVDLSHEEPASQQRQDQQQQAQGAVGQPAEQPAVAAAVSEAQQLGEAGTSEHGQPGAQLQHMQQQQPVQGALDEQQQQQQQQGSSRQLTVTTELPVFEEMEQLIAGLGSGDGHVGLEELRGRRARFLRHLELIGRLEQSCLGALSRELDAAGAVAALCGRRRRYLLRRTAVMLGRSTGSAGKVDVDLAGEGPHAQTVSRHQAQLLLEPDGRFWLRCLGRRNVFVNGRQLERGAALPLPHLSLIKAGGVALLFMVNHAAVQRLTRRSAALSVL